MSIPNDMEQRFLSGQRSERVRFAINDAVRITSGPHAGRKASVISLVRADPEAIFIVEPGEAPWGDIEVAQSDLALVE